MRASIFALLGALCACSAQRAPRVDDSLPREECRGRADGLLCQDDEALTCANDEVVAQENCRAAEQLCLMPRGCVRCSPGTYSCDGQRRLRCNEDGSDYELVETCDEGVSCSGSGCRDLCADALDKRSYIGCEYYPVFTSNEYLDERFLPAVVIANPNLTSAHVTIRGAKGFARELDVGPSSVETVMLEYLPALRTPTGSSLVRGGAYRLVSSVPVTVHQFNPLLFEIDQDCIGKEDSNLRRPNDDKCNSFSNDASLLLPAHVLSQPDGGGTAYFAISRPTLKVAVRTQGPYRPPSAGFVAIVGTAPEPVQVHVTSSAHTRASGEGSEEVVAALAPGETANFELGRGDVLQLLSGAPETCPEPWLMNDDGEFSCPLGAEYDLTGTLIEADGPIEVIGGHNCAYVPFNRVACDHLEETMFPLETWGVEAVAPRPRTGTSSPHVVRVLSAAADNTVRFEPFLVHEPVELGRGESFELITDEHLVLRADKPIAVAQFLVGQGIESRVGDPSLSLAIPTEQYRSSYAFLSPSSYDVSYVSVIARAGDEVKLDGVTLGGFAPIGDGSFTVATATLRKSGVHEVHSEHNQGIGLNVYGYGDYTSYMVPGGLDLRVISVLY